MHADSNPLFHNAFSLLLLGGGGITAINIEMREQALREAESKARGPEA